MKFKYISKFKILENFKLEIEFDDKYLYIYKWVTDININKYIDDTYLYNVIDYFSFKITNKNHLDINNFFSIKYSDKFINDKIIWTMNFLQIEWDLTIYAIYKDLVIINIE